MIKINSDGQKLTTHKIFSRVLNDEYYMHYKTLKLLVKDLTPVSGTGHFLRVKDLGKMMDC